jgi:hypothetical protein
MQRFELVLITALAALALGAAEPLPPAPADPAGRLSRDSLPAAGEGEAMLTVTAPGRFALRAESRSGVALSLVDMIAGPGEPAGEAGARDGRLDLLLDTGTYKVRTSGAERAPGAAAPASAEARLRLEPFRAAAPASAALLRGGETGAELADLQQRSFWVLAGAAGRVEIEAVGRALADLRLWRNGSDLSELAPALATIEPAPGHALTRARLEGTVEPGLYLVTAYGGTPLPWADGDTQKPFHIRSGPPRELAAGAAEETIGPFGSLRFLAPAGTTYLRLELPEPAAARLTVTPAGGSALTVELARNSREPMAALSFAARPQDRARIEVSGLSGQRVRLRALRPASALRIEGSGPHLIAVDVAGEGGDEVPATVVLARFDKVGAPVVLAASAPRVGLDQAWRRKLNLRGPTSLLVQVISAGPVAVRTTGPNVRTSLAPLLGSAAPRADGRQPEIFDLEPGWYLLRLDPVDKAVGILDLLIGPPGLVPEPGSTPPRSSIALGRHELNKDSAYQVFVNAAPGLVTAPVARAVAVEPAPAPAPEEPLPPLVLVAEQSLPLVAGQPRFLDLGRGETRSFRLDVPEGGLYQIETLGRLKTAAAIATPFLPRLDEAADNGAGHNALLQTWLRAGSYRLRVTAADSAGHLGVRAAPAHLHDAGMLVAEGSARASLRGGEGAAFTIDIAEAGTYRLDLYGLGRTLTARLEDAQGWPLTAPGEMTELERRFAPGRYRLVVLPPEVDARVVARLRRVIEPPTPEGHGPHAIAFDSPQKFQWREPAGRDAERLPDRWVFALAGRAQVALDITDGMVADLIREDGDARAVARIVHKRGFSGMLDPGRYRVEAKSLGRNDRLDYELSLRSVELQPDFPRFLPLPATIPFAIAVDRVVSLTTFGRTDLIGVLTGENGRIIERLAGRSHDWNIAMSRRLPAGAYRLELAKASADVRPAPEPDSEETAEAESEAAEAPLDVELRLHLPDTADEALAFGSGAFDSRVHVLSLPAVEAGRLLVAAAQSSAELALSLERRDGDGRWQVVSSERGRAPVVAVPGDREPRPWRLAVWTIDGGSATVTMAARTLSLDAQPPGSVTLTPVALDGMAPTLRAALVATPGAALVSIAPAAADRSAVSLRQGSTPGRALSPVEGSLLPPQSDRLWLIDRGEGPGRLTVSAAPLGEGEIALSLAAGDTATLAPAPVPAGRRRLWQATSAFGQPGLSAGAGMGVAAGSALALAGPVPPRVWNAGGTEPLQLRVNSLLLTEQPPVVASSTLVTRLPPRSAQPVQLRPGSRPVELALAAGTAAVASGNGVKPITVWSGREAVSRRLAGRFTDLLLINPGDEPAAVTLALPPEADAGALAAGTVMKRFFGAAGSLSLRVEAASGDRLVVAGGDAAFIGDDGSVRRGTAVALTGPGELVVTHGAGLVAAWVERAGAAPWPAVAAQPVTTPQRIALTGEAMAFALRQDTPVLLHARTSAPVILELAQGGSNTPQMFPAGAELHRHLAAGAAELRVYSPHDGPLAGSIELTASPVMPAGEGLGDAQALAPGGTALFGFEVTRTATTGVGIRAEPDLASVRLLDAEGRPLGEGVAQLHRLKPGRYLLEARAPTDRMLTVRPAIVGIAPAPTGPPPDVARQYFEMVGLKPSRPQ